MTNAALRRAAAGSVLALACLGTAAPAAIAMPAPTTQATSISSAAPASLPTGLSDCREAAASATNLRLKVSYALADRECRHTLESLARRAIRSGGDLAEQICDGSRQPGRAGLIFQLMLLIISDGEAAICAPY